MVDYKSNLSRYNRNVIYFLFACLAKLSQSIYTLSIVNLQSKLVFQKISCENSNLYLVKHTNIFRKRFLILSKLFF